MLLSAIRRWRERRRKRQIDRLQRKLTGRETLRTFNPATSSNQDRGWPTGSG